MRIQLADSNAFMSKVADNAVNVGQYATADHVGILYNPFQPPIPDVAKTADQMIGDGNERAQRLRRGWGIPIQLPIAGLLSTETSGRIGTRALGGTRTPGAEIAVGSGVFDIVTLMQPKSAGRTPKLSTVGFDLGGYKFVFPSLAVGNYEMAFEGEGDVTFSSNLINTALWRYNDAAAALQAMGYSAGEAAVFALNPVIVPPVAPAHHLMAPFMTKVTFSDGTSMDFAADGNLISGACGLNNQPVVEQVPGDPPFVATNRKLGAYARNIYRGDRVPMARLKIAVDNSLRTFVTAQKGTDITDLRYLFRSDDPIGNTAYFYEYEWVCDLAEIESVVSDPQASNAALTINFYPKPSPINNGSYFWQRVRTDDQTLQ